MKKLEIKKNCIALNITLAEKFLKDKKVELASHRMADARKGLEELFEDIKKAN